MSEHLSRPHSWLCYHTLTLAMNAQLVGRFLVVAKIAPKCSDKLKVRLESFSFYIILLYWRYCTTVWCLKDVEYSQWWLKMKMMQVMLGFFPMKTLHYLVEWYHWVMALSPGICHFYPFDYRTHDISLYSPCIQSLVYLWFWAQRQCVVLFWGQCIIIVQLQWHLYIRMSVSLECHSGRPQNVCSFERNENCMAFYGLHGYVRMYSTWLIAMLARFKSEMPDPFFSHSLSTSQLLCWWMFTIFIPYHAYYILMTCKPIIKIIVPTLLGILVCG